jgi:hypothetical protein
MRCDCCDAELNDEEATAKFTESGNYVQMCKGCRKFLPRNIKITVRTDLEPNKEKDEATGLDALFEPKYLDVEEDEYGENRRE